MGRTPLSFEASLFLLCLQLPVAILGFERFFLRQQPGGVSLSFTDALDLDCRGFDDLLHARQSRHDLRISAGVDRLSLRLALAEEVRTGKRARENTNSRKDSNERDDCPEVTCPHLKLLSDC